MSATPSSSTEAPAKKATVSLRGVRVVFKNPDTGKCQCVLGGLNLDVFPGEILCVVGPSGCGKSTLLNGIGGFRPFTEGVALLDGAPIGPPDRDRGVVFQDYPVLNFCTALGNVAAGLDFERFSLFANLLPFTRRRRSRENRQRALDYLRTVGMEEHAHKYPAELSGGQRQRVAIAQAIAMRPKVLLMDEPFSGLDPDTRERLQLVVLKLHRELHNTIFFVTHDLEEAVFLGDRIVVLSQFAPGRTPDMGATIVHEQRLHEYKDAAAKGTTEFAQLIRELRAKYHLNSK
jgi:NitT/TauT family transport system ATP-binding protein